MKISYSSNGGLEALAAAFDSLAADAPRLLGEAAAEGGGKALAAEFESESDPAGNPWAKRVPPTGSWSILTKSGKMRGSRTAKAFPSAAEFTVDTPAEFHQNGTRRMVARKLLPSRSLPEPWRLAIEKAVHDRIGERLRRAS